jgi:hypothetical protein
MLQWRTTESNLVPVLMAEPDSAARKSRESNMQQIQSPESSGKESATESNATGSATNPPSGSSHEREERKVSGKDVSSGKEPQRPPLPPPPPPLRPGAKKYPGSGFSAFDGEYYI